MTEQSEGLAPFRAEIQWTEEPTPGTLSYIREDQSFLLTAARRPFHGSIVINYLQLWIEGDGQVWGVDGYAPQEAWLPTSAGAPKARPGGLSFPNIATIELNGQAIDFEPREWPSYENSDGWVVVGDARATGDAVEFAPGSVAVVSDHRLRALWLRPGSRDIRRR